MSPRSSKLNEELRAESRARILAAALEQFAEFGYKGTTVARIAGAAGVSQGLLYHYFSDKAALLRAVFELGRELTAEAVAAAEAEPDPTRRVEILLRSSTAVLKAHLRFFRLAYGSRMQPALLADIGPAFSAWSSEVRERIERMFEDVGAPRPALEAALLLGSVDGVHQHYALDPESFPLDEVVDLLIRRYAAEIARWQLMPGR